jgi:excisionase family DNA binding protein
MADIMTVNEVASYLRVNKKTMYRLISEGNIPATKVGHQYRLSKTAVDDWLRKESVSVKVSILVIDDEETILALFQSTLGELGHTVVAAGSSAEGLEFVKQRHFDIVFLDLKMPGMDGADLFRQIKIAEPKLPVIIITGYPDGEMMARALAEGPFGVMKKPFSESDIVATLSNFIRAAKG